MHGARRIFAAIGGLLVMAFGAAAAQAAVNVSMTLAPGGYANPIRPGDVTAIRFSITNDDATSAVTNANFSAALGSGLRAVRVVPGSYVCTAGSGASVPTVGTVTATAGGTTATLVGGSIPAAAPGGASGECLVDIEVTSTTANSTGTARIEIGDLTGTAGGAPVSNGSAASQTITVLSLTPATLNKQFNVSTATVGNPFTMTVTVGNPNAGSPLTLNGAGDSPAYGVEDLLPAGMQIAPTPAASTTCAGGSVDTATAGRVRLVGGTVPGAGSCTFQVNLVTTTSGSGSSTSLNNTINGTTGFHNNRGLTANNTSDSLTSRAMLRVDKAFSLSAIAHGRQSSLTITLRNDSTTQSLTLAQPFRDSPLDQHGVAGYGLKVAPAGPTTTCAGVVTTTAGNAGVELATGTVLAPNSNCTITVPFIATLQTAGVPQTFINNIAEGAVQLTDASVISTPATATVVVVDQLTVSKTIFPSPAQIAPGNPVRFTITVNNFAAGALTNVAVRDALPAGMTLLPTAPAAPSYSGAACSGTLGVNAGNPAVPIFTIPNMAAGSGHAPATCSITFYAQTPPGAAPATVLSNTIGAGDVTATGPGGPITNNGGSGTVNATIRDVATVNKAFNPATAPEGVVSQLTVQFTNLSAAPITGASFTDNLPVGSTGGQLIVATPANASTTCGGTVTAAPGASTVTLSGATLPARANNGAGAAGSCTLTVSVIGGAGNYVNSLPAGALTGTETLADGATRSISSPGPVDASLTYSSALSATKGFLPTTISSGGVSTVTITLGNNASGTLNNVSVNDPLPTGMTIAPTPNAQTTCAAGTIVAAAGASSIQMTGAQIPSGIQCTLKFDVTATGATSWTNTIPVGGVTADGGVRNTTPVTATLANSTTGGVVVTNAMSIPSLTSPGQVSVLTVTITNNGAIDLTNVRLTDYFTVDGLSGGAPNGLVVASSPNAQTTCTSGVATASAGGTQLALNGATIPAGAACTFSVNVTMTSTGTLQNTIPTGAIVSEQGVSNTLPTQTSLSAGSNLGIVKVFTPAVIRPNETSRLRIQLINPSASLATALQVTDTLPAGLLVATPANTFTNCTNATVTAAAGSASVNVSGGQLPAASGGVSSTCYVELDVTAAAAGAYDNVIAAGALTGSVGGVPTNNAVPANATLQVRSPLTLAKVFNPQLVDPGQPTTVTLTLTNANAIALTGAFMRDNLPAGLTVALTPNPATTCVGGTVNAAVSATFVTLTGATIPAGGACTVSFDAVSNVSGVYVNTIPAGNITTTQGVTNELPATDTVRVTSRPTVNKQFSPASIPAGGVSTLTIVLGNSNTGEATLSSPLVDTLPTSPFPIVVASPNGLVSTCTGTAATAVAGAGVVTLPTGARIPPGGCTVQVNVTGANEGTYTNTIPVNALVTDFGNNTQPANADLTISPLGYISGKVFKDGNVTPNGVFDGPDVPLAGVTIVLTGTDYGADGVAGGGDDTTVNRTVVTDALGNYVFSGLNPGQYTVTQPTQPAGTVNGAVVAGSIVGVGGGTAGSASTPGGTSGAIGGIILLKDGAGRVSSSPNNNFAEIELSSISGSIFLDQNDDGVRNAADTSLQGVTVELLRGGVVVATTTTGSDGSYRFSNLEPGTYTVREPTQPTGTANGKTIAGAVGSGGTAGTPTAQGVVPSAIVDIILPPGVEAAGNDFAEVPAGRQVSGRVFADQNDDGVFNPGSDTGLSGVTVVLTGTDFNGVAVSPITTTTASDGRYVFTGLAPGVYIVTEPNQPSGTRNGKTVAGSTGGVVTAEAVTPSVISGIDLTGANTISTDNNFAEIQLPSTPQPPSTSSITGRVYVDANDNGQPDAGEPGVPGVTIRLTGTSTTGEVIDRTTQTGANGDYVFDNVPPSGPGGYRITEVQPSGYNDGKTTPGSSGTAVTSKPIAVGGSDVIDGVVLTSGTPSTGHNFGERQPNAEVHGVVYFDADGDGAQGADEPGIAGVTVRLTGVDSTGARVELTTTTDANGAFSFTNVPPSDATGYTITQVQPSAEYVDGATTIAPGAPGTTMGEKPVSPGGSDIISGVVLSPGAAARGYAFGERKPVVVGDLLVTKTTPKLWVNRGDLVPYTITVTNPGTATVANVTVRDQLPAGFRYREASATREGVPVDPRVDGGFVAWPAESFAPQQKKTYSLMLVVGSGVGDGDYVNRAWAGLAPGGSQISNLATAAVRIAPDPTFDCSDIIGKVFDDRNSNGYQDEGEPGIPAVRMASVNGLLITSDAEGRFHVPCPMTPNMDRGSNFVLKLDPRSLPSGYRVTTENPRDVRLTRGKMTKLNFGATVHRVVRVELTGEAFEPGKTELKPEWRAKVDAIQEPLRERPSIVRIAYGPGDDPPDLVRRRTKAVRGLIERAWKNHKRQYALVIEIEGEQ